MLFTSFSLFPELLLYLIVGGVVGGVLLVLVLLVVFCFITQYVRRQHRGGKISESITSDLATRTLSDVCVCVLM